MKLLIFNLAFLFASQALAYTDADKKALRENIDNTWVHNRPFLVKDPNYVLPFGIETAVSGKITNVKFQFANKTDCLDFARLMNKKHASEPPYDKLKLTCVERAPKSPDYKIVSN